MPFVREPFDQGVVTSRHATLLNPGELTRGEDSRYDPNDPAIKRAWGRTKYINSNGQISGGSVKVKGLAYCAFEPNHDGASDDFIVAHVSDKYYVSVFTGRTGTISGTTIDNIGSGNQLDAAYGQNKWYLFNGNGSAIPNQVLKSGTGNPASRRHGLVPVAVTPTNPPVSTTAGSWPLDEVYWGVGRFYFFTTEVVNPGGVDELESAFMGEPPYVELQKDGTGAIPFNVVVQRHNPLANSNATQVNVYMVKASLNQAWNDSLLALAVRVGTISVSATPANDKITLSSNLSFADPGHAPNTVTVVSGTISNQNNVKVEDGSVATVASGNTATIDITDWGFAVGAGTAITGMKMFIRYRSQGLGFASISAAFRFGAGPTVGTTKQFTTGSNDFVLHQQPFPATDTDVWGLSLVGSDVNSTNFGVRLVIQGINAPAEIDVVKIRLFTSTLASIGKNYPIVVVQEGNVQTVGHANLPPPVASTGDIKDGVMVTNNVSNDGEIAWSLPSKYDYFPALFRMRLGEGHVKSPIMKVRTVGDLMMVWARHQTYRVNYLPLSTDSEFVTGRSWEEISSDHGAVSAQGVATFTPPASPGLAAFVSDNGIYITEGSRVRIVTEDLDWAAMVDVTQLSKAVLTNYPTRFVLKFDFVLAGSGATENNRYLLLHYHPSHLKGGDGQVRFKILGPNVMKTASSIVAKLNAENVLLTGHTTDGRIYVEDNGVDNTEGTAMSMIFETREIYVADAGPGHDGSIIGTWVHQNGAGASMTVTSQPRYRSTGSALTNHSPTETFTPSVEGLAAMQHHFGPVGSVRFQYQLPDAGTNGAVSFTYMVYEKNDHGRESPGG